MTEPNDLADVTAALRDLAAALAPALTPAMRPTWDQQRWAPAADAFGPPTATPLAAGTPTHPTLPPHVVTDELIESAWGNDVATMFELIGRTLNGTCPGGDIAAGGQGPVASIALPAGAWLVAHQALMSSVAPIAASLRVFVGGALYTDAAVRGNMLTGASYSVTGHVLALATSDVDFTVTVNVVNGGTAAVGTFADPTNHRIFAIGGRSL